MPELRTTSNYFIVNLAFADFMITAVSMPSNLLGTSQIKRQWHGSKDGLIMASELPRTSLTTIFAKSQYIMVDTNFRPIYEYIYLIFDIFAGAFVGSDYFHHRPMSCWGKDRIVLFLP